MARSLGPVLLSVLAFSCQISIITSDVDVDGKECPRFSLDEFSSSVFMKTLDLELSFLRETLNGAMSGLTEIAEGLDNKNGTK